jgi:hypothetical protein
MLGCLLAPATLGAQSRCEEQARDVPGEGYFMILAGRFGAFYDRSGPAFAMVIKARAKQIEIDAVGIYADAGKPAFGAVPASTYVAFMQEPREPSGVTLRLRLTHAQYERAHTIVRMWDRRAREGALLYPDIAMDNILLVKQVTESLNACGERLALYSLDWGVEDNISENNPPTHIPLQYFRELRRLNESRHLRDGVIPVPAR